MCRVFFFQAEDGIRDADVTGVQTCALPISHVEICARPWNGFYLPHPTWMGRIEWFRRHRYTIPDVVRAEDQDLLLRTYDSSRFACVDEILFGYRKAPQSLGRLWTARINLARAQLRVHAA